MKFYRAAWLGGWPMVTALPEALAADAGAAQTSTFAALFQALLGLAVVLALMYVFFWLLRRYGPTQMAAQGVVKVVGGVMLGPRERLVVVEVQGTWLLVGVASGHVSLLHSMVKPADIPAGAIPAMPPFADKLSDFLQRARKG